MPYFCRMKMTMHIDEAKLQQVMEFTGASTKTKAVELALEAMVKRGKLQSFAKRGLGLTPDELENAWEDPFPEETARREAARKKAATSKNGNARSGR